MHMNIVHHCLLLDMSLLYIPVTDLPSHSSPEELEDDLSVVVPGRCGGECFPRESYGKVISHDCHTVVLESV